MDNIIISIDAQSWKIIVVDDEKISIMVSEKIEDKPLSMYEEKY